jgi:hypothetical protein
MMAADTVDCHDTAFHVNLIQQLRDFLDFTALILAFDFP